MIVEIASRSRRRKVSMSSRAFGKLLHLARFNGWRPEKDAPDSPSRLWDTEIILPTWDLTLRELSPKRTLMP